MRKWYLIDVKEKSLGRIATKVADLLRGKKKPEFEYNKDVGDYAVIINTDELAINPKRAEKKFFYHHTGFPGGLKKETLAERMKKDSREVFRKAVLRMLPANRLRKNWLKRLKIYKNENHQHQAQKLEKIEGV